MKNEQNEKKNRDLGHAPLRQLGGFHENVLYPFFKKNIIFKLWNLNKYIYIWHPLRLDLMNSIQ